MLVLEVEFIIEYVNVTQSLTSHATRTYTHPYIHELHIHTFMHLYRWTTRGDFGQLRRLCQWVEAGLAEEKAETFLQESLGVAESLKRSVIRVYTHTHTHINTHTFTESLKRFMIFVLFWRGLRYFYSWMQIGWRRFSGILRYLKETPGISTLAP